MLHTLPFTSKYPDVYTDTIPCRLQAKAKKIAEKIAEKNEQQQHAMQHAAMTVQALVAGWTTRKHEIPAIKSHLEDQQNTRKLKLAVHEKKRENLKKIHAASEANLDEILKKEASRQLRMRPKPQGMSSKKLQVMAIALAIVAAGGGIAFANEQSMADEVTSLPGYLCVAEAEALPDHNCVISPEHANIQQDCDQMAKERDTACGFKFAHSCKAATNFYHKTCKQNPAQNVHHWQGGMGLGKQMNSQALLQESTGDDQGVLATTHTSFDQPGTGTGLTGVDANILFKKCQQLALGKTLVMMPAPGMIQKERYIRLYRDPSLSSWTSSTPFKGSMDSFMLCKELVNWSEDNMQGTVTGVDAANQGALMAMTEGCDVPGGANGMGSCQCTATSCGSLLAVSPATSGGSIDLFLKKVLTERACNENEKIAAADKCTGCTQAQIETAQELCKGYDVVKTCGLTHHDAPHMFINPMSSPDEDPAQSEEWVQHSGSSTDDQKAVFGSNEGIANECAIL